MPATTSTTTTIPAPPLPAPVVTSATCSLSCRRALILFEPVAGAAGYVVTHPDLDTEECRLTRFGVCLVSYGGRTPPPDDAQFRLVAVDASGRRGTPSAPFPLVRPFDVTPS